ncbi:hypothetical protein VTN77DRAFT_9511 [Rasamsonia byssochlamydoides]|uniref:uncharacterized protein n=1 Tax=Rasamsonia byssochlamydoides TaxID=89139 RepID=UPI0037441B73
MGTTDHGSGATTTTKRSGRRVAHSRGGCLTCKRRKLRCPENKPICERCWNDNKPCSYAIQLQWEDDSRKRGIKHGRSTRVADATTTASTWIGLPIAGKVRHFLNTSACDVEDGMVATTALSSSWSQSLLFAQKPTLSAWPRAYPTLSLDDDGRDAYLFDYYWQYVCENMTLVDGSFNTFRQLILPLALSSESVMQMVLALGALSLNAAGRDGLYTIALRHKHRSMQLLRRHIARTETAANDQNLVVILMLCVFEISDNCQLSWSTHLCAALDLMRLATQQGGISMITPEVSSFVSRFFLVKDALGRTACGKRAKIKQLPTVNSGEIDPSIGCSYELIGIISAITDLSREMAQADASGLSFTASTAWLEKTAQIEHQLDSLTQYLPSSISSSHTSTSSTSSSPSASDILLRTSSLIHTAAKLYYLATLRSIDPYSPTARQLVQDAIEWTRPLSPTHLRSAHLWPLFVAAVYATEDEERVFFLDQFDVLEGQHSALVAAGAVGRVRGIVETVWKRRDLRSTSTSTSTSSGSSSGSSSSDTPSMLATEEESPQTWPQTQNWTWTWTRNDWARYVQPMSEGLCLG